MVPIKKTLIRSITLLPILLVFLLLGPNSAQGGADLLWTADHETGDLSQWTLPSVVGPGFGGSSDSGSCTRPANGVSTTTAKVGTFSMEMTTDASPGSTSACRQFRFSESTQLDDPLYYSAWLYFPETYSVLGSMDVMQFTSESDNRDDPVWSLELRNRPNGQMYFALRWEGQIPGPTNGEGTGVKYYHQDFANVQPNTWTHVEMYLDQSDAVNYAGQLIVWQDNVAIFTKSGIATNYGGDSLNRWAVTAKGESVTPSSVSVFVDEVNISLTKVGGDTTPTPTVSVTPDPTPTITPVLSSTPTATPLLTPTPTAQLTTSPVPTSSVSITPSVTGSTTPSPSVSISPSPTLSITPTIAPPISTPWTHQCEQKYIELSGLGMGSPDSVINPQVIELDDPSTALEVVGQVSGRGFKENTIPTEALFQFDGAAIMTTHLNDNSESWSFEASLPSQPEYEVSVDMVGSESYKTPRAITLYATREASENWTSQAAVDHRFVYWKKATVVEESVSIPALTEDVPVYVSVALIDNDHASQDIEVEVESGGVTVMETHASSTLGKELNILNIELASVPAGTNSVIIRLKSEDQAGESFAMVGYTINYPCDGTSHSEEPFSEQSKQVITQTDTNEADSDEDRSIIEELIQRITELIEELQKLLEELFASLGGSTAVTPTPTPAAGQAGFPLPTLVITPPLNGIPGVAVLGDSNSDEYRADDARASTTDREQTTLNWVEHITKLRSDKVQFGVWSNSSRGEPRRSGYEYNWARSSATSTNMIGAGQHFGAAQQINSGDVQLAVIQIGSNDFAFYNTVDGYEPIYDGSLSGSDLTAKIDGIVDNIELAINTLRLEKGDNVGVVVSTIMDWNLHPHILENYLEADKRALVSDAINEANQKIKALVESFGSGSVFVHDLNAFAQSIFQSVDANGVLLVGGEEINYMRFGSEPNNGFLNDRIHPGTVLQGLTANSYIELVNDLLGVQLVAPLTDSEILANAGM